MGLLPALDHAGAYLLSKGATIVPSRILVTLYHLLMCAQQQCMGDDLERVLGSWKQMVLLGDMLQEDMASRAGEGDADRGAHHRCVRL